MGASFALALGRARPAVELLGVDRDDHTVRRAVQLGVVSAASPEAELIAGSDLVVLAVPVGQMRSVLAQVAPYVGGAVVTDMASTKTSVMEWAAELGIDLVGGHPMCGLERSGIDAADPTIFRGARWLLTRPEPMVESVVKAVGAVPVIIEAAEHDALVAGVSHAAFMVSTAYVLAMAAAPGWERMQGLAAGGYRDMSRLAAGDPDVYQGIAATNAAEIAVQLEAVEKTLAELRGHLAAGDGRLRGLFEAAREIRLRWEREREAGA